MHKKVKRRYKKRPTNRKVRNAVSKVYKGIKFRSKLELFTYMKLEEADIKSLYEKKKFVLMEGFRFPNRCVEPHKSKGYIDMTAKIRDITYTPDFVDPNGKWIIEVKGFANDVFPIKWKLFKNYLMEGGHDYVLFLPKNQKQVLETIELIKEL
tara:strand:+ start:4107 stop:4565 length:459 start_codon:yes stop_codon:yes gene_type:complete